MPSLARRRAPAFTPGMASVLLVLVTAAGLSTASGARAEESSVTVHELDPKTGLALERPDQSLTYLVPGAGVSLLGGKVSGLSGLVELSLTHYKEPRIPSFGYGAFTQLEMFQGKNFRTSLGAQVSLGPAGAELGLALRAGNGEYATTLSPHLGAFLSIGYFVVGFRISPAIVAFPSNEPSYGLESAFSFTFKLPIAIQGRDPTGWAIQATGRRW
ncbi:MAG TPA: hypothetical protein VGI39_13420 [Polyangiaceae bacterium]|jgi:hypothetical protein